MVIFHALAQWLGQVVMPFYQGDDVFRLPSCHLYPPFDTDMVTVLHVSIPEPIDKSIDNRFYAVIVLIFGYISNNITFSVSFPPIRTGLPIEWIWCHSEF